MVCGEVVQATEHVHPRMTVAIAVHAIALATLAAPAIAGPAMAAAAVVAAAAIVVVASVAVATLRLAAFEYPVLASEVVASVLVAFVAAATFGPTGIAVAAVPAAVMSLAETLVALWRSADPKHLECQVDNKYLVKCRTDTPGPSGRHKELQKTSLCPLSA